jgi:hypothetical protein
MPTQQQSWLVVSYDPVAPFSLRMSRTTSKGGKTLVVPTPYAVKMALIDACFRLETDAGAEETARQIFDAVKARPVCFRPPPHCVVQNTFVKVLDADRDSDLPFKQTIAYREFALFSGGPLEVAIEVAGLDSEQRQLIALLFWHINSIGKRGSFWQCVGVETITGPLPNGFTVSLAGGQTIQPKSFAMVQHLDDFGDDLCKAKDGFDRISTYGGGAVTFGKHRVLVSSAIPYRRRGAAKRFTWYERLV